jgi:hypothetical protein
MKMKKYLKYFPIAAGAILGYAYYHFIGCHNGACAIQSNPYFSTIYGAIIGSVFLLPDKKKKQKESDDGE